MMSFCSRLLPHVAEGHPELSSDLRPKLPENVDTHILNDGKTDLPHGWGESMLVARMVGAGDNYGTNCSQPLGKIEHVLTAIAIRDEGVRRRMYQAFPPASVAQAVVTRVFREHCRVSEILEESPGRLRGEVDAEAFPIACGALSEVGVPVCRLI